MARQVNGHLGTFATVAELTAKFAPSEYVGCSANVGTAAPYVKYWCDGQVWAGLPASELQNFITNTQSDGFSWYNLPEPYAYKGQSVFIRDVGIGGSMWRSTGTRWVPEQSGLVVLAHQTWASTDATDSSTTPVKLFSYIVPPLLFAPGSTLIVSAKAKWPGLSVARTLGLYFGAAQFASATSSSNTCVGTKVEGWEIHAGQTDVSVFLGEAAATAGDNQVQTAALATVSTGNNTYREISLRGIWGTADTGSNVITLEYARLELAWGT